jgi:transposase, IS5 family
MKITTRCGSDTVEALNEALLAKAVEARVLKTNRVRADTTVIEANVAYPSESGLLAKGVAKMAAVTKQLQCLGLVTRTRVRDRTRSMRRRARAIGANLRHRTGEAQDQVRAITAEMAVIASRGVAGARTVLRNARRALARRGEAPTTKTATLVANLERVAARVERVAAQTRQRISGVTPDGATRIVSLHDPDARPIVKGRLGKTSRVRLQSPSRRQSRRDRARP